MYYATIKKVDIANGTGVRVSLFVSGCTHHCPECFNEVAWDFHYGEEFTSQTIDDLIELMRQPHIQGLSLLGGEPMEPTNQEGLLPLLQKMHQELPSKDVWCYTGYDLEDLLEGGRAHCFVSDELLSYIDVLADGPFIQAEKNIRLKFRGSNNQRVIDMKKTREQNQIVLWDEK